MSGALGGADGADGVDGADGAQGLPGPRDPVVVALVQLEVTGDREDNLRSAVAAVEAAADEGARLVVLPEYASGFTPTGTGAEHAEPLDGPFVAALRGAAVRRAVAVIAGTTLPGSGPRAVNAVVALAAGGELAGVYRKVHLYDAFGHRESDRLEPGDPSAPPLVLDHAGLRFGVLTCYDLRFPETARRLVDAGADVLVVPAAWTAGRGKLDHWRVLSTARAIENVSYVLAAGQCGPGRCGHTRAVGPDGVLLDELGARPATLLVELEPARLAAERERNPSVAGRRYRVVPQLGST